MTLFPFADYWWFYLAFGGFVLAVLALDLGVFHRKTHEVTTKEALGWTGVWVGMALAFNVVLYFYARWKFASDPTLLAQPGFLPEAAARQSALEFLTGFLLEKALAVDNIFVFALIFGHFAIPRLYQHRVLFYGILGALAFRAAFVALGAYLMAYHWVIIAFGVLLIVTGVKMIFASEKETDLEANLFVRLLKKVVRVHPKIEGPAFFIRKNGALFATPLFLALALIELSDIVFALDSVPAIFAVTKEPLIVFTSNIFAIMGLRSMYVLLARAIDRFAYIKYGLALVLVFVGLKMAWLSEAMEGGFPISWSLAIIAALIGGSIAISLAKAPPAPGIRPEIQP